MEPRSVLYIVVCYHTCKCFKTPLIFTSYSKLSIGIPWNIPQSSCIFLVDTPALRLPFSGTCTVVSKVNWHFKRWWIGLWLGINAASKHVFWTLSAGVLFIWGALCLKLSHMHFSHSLFLKRLNVLVMCLSVVVEIIQPDLNAYRVSGDIIPFFTAWDVSLPLNYPLI